MSVPAWFLEPAAEFAPSTYWFWHRRPTEEEVKTQVAEIARGGFKTFLIQARIAYPLEEYLDEGFLAAYRLAVEEAARHGLEVGIYDDYNWASGHAGGRTVRDADHLRERQLFWSTSPLEGTSAECHITNVRSMSGDWGGPALKRWTYEDGVIAWADWELVSVLVHPVDEGTESAGDVTAFATIEGTGPDGCSIRIELDEPLPDGWAVTAFVSARCTTSRLMNYLLPEATQRFIEVGYEPFHDVLGEYFGNPIKYMFIDHPGAGSYDWDERYGAVGNSIPFAWTLRSAFEAAHDATLGLALLSLLRDVGETTTKLRADFFATYSQLVCENFLGGISAWSREHGIGLAGHEMLAHIGGWGLGGGYGNADIRTNFGDDYFAIEAYRTHTTVDASNFAPQITAKVGDSVARAHGRSGCILEQYAVSTAPGVPSAAGQWGLTLETLRAAAIRHHLFGAKQFLFHGFYQTDGDDSPELFSNARFDFAPGINFEPWYALHDDFAAESGRLASFIFTAEPACDVALLFPRVTHWVEPADWEPYHAHTEFWFRHLTERGYGFHLVDERELTTARIESGRLWLGERGYGALVLPAVTAVAGAQTASLVEAFAASGGTVVASGPLPRFTQERGRDPDVEHAFSELFDAQATATHFPELPAAAAVDEILPDRQHPHLVADGPVWQWAGRDSDGWRLACFNDTAEPLTVGMRGGEAVERWDCATGEVVEWAGGEPFDLEPMELICLRATDDGRAAGAPRLERKVKRTVTLDEGWTLDSRPIDVDRGWEKQGLDDYSAAATYELRFDLDDAAGTWELELP
ncbi:MAG: hypothetical protein QOE91_1150, partial [Gaiellaceae bacterium]|nr:hypothetical protein [Gaiellaceae bacterium]